MMMYYDSLSDCYDDAADDYYVLLSIKYTYHTTIFSNNEKYRLIWFHFTYRARNQANHWKLNEIFFCEKNCIGTFIWLKRVHILLGL